MRITGRTARNDTPYFKTSCVVMGERQIETFEAMVALTGRRPHQLVADIVLDAVRAAQQDHETQHMVSLLKRGRRSVQGKALRIVKDAEP